jgi:hypothetical protein
VKPEGVRGDNYVNTVIVKFDTGESTTILTGGEIIDGQIQNTVFARPILWLSR